MFSRYVELKDENFKIVYLENTHAMENRHSTQYVYFVSLYKFICIISCSDKYIASYTQNACKKENRLFMKSVSVPPVTNGEMCWQSHIKLPNMIICLVVLELLHVERHGNTKSTFFFTSHCKSIRRGGLIQTIHNVTYHIPHSHKSKTFSKGVPSFVPRQAGPSDILKLCHILHIIMHSIKCHCCV